MTMLPYAAAAVMALLGSVHLVCALHDFGPRPRYFAPVNTDVLRDMQATRTGIAPQGRDYWSGILGFHLSHGLGVLMFAALVIVTTQHGIAWLKPVLVLIALAYLAISLRCWFAAPSLGIGLTIGLLGAGWWL
jgi:hypothetical protein